MVRIYLDWNVFTSLKDSNKILLNKLRELKNYLQIPYTYTHVKELKKGIERKNELTSNIDLRIIDELTTNHCLRWDKDGTEPLIGSIKEYFKDDADIDDLTDLFSISNLLNLFEDNALALSDEKFSNPLASVKTILGVIPHNIQAHKSNKEIVNKLLPNFRENGSMWDLISDFIPTFNKFFNDAEFYKSYRNIIKNQGFKLDSNSGNWNQSEVIEKINLLLKQSGSEADFHELLKMSFKNQKKELQVFEYFIAEYLSLDLFGYKSDKLKKRKNTPQNIIDDATHAFYGGYCDYFITDDKNLRKKASVLYNDFKIDTTVLSSSEFLDKVDSIVHNLKKTTPSDLFHSAVELLDFDNPTEYHPKKAEDEVETYVYKLSYYYLNYFNYLIYQDYEELKISLLTFRRVYNNFSRFVFYSENIALVNALFNMFGKPENADELIEKFTRCDEECSFIWDSGQVKFRCFTEPEIFRLSMQIIILEESE